MAEQTTENERPPFGLVPQHIADEIYAIKRAFELIDAMTRFAEAGKSAPVEWCTELKVRVSDLLKP